MFGHDIFDFETIDRHIIAFGKLFSDMRIRRRDPNGTVEQVLRVPLTYAPKNKLLLKADVDQDATKTAAVELPRMAFQLMPNMQYDGSRKLTNLNKMVWLDSEQPNHLKREYVPVPYNLNMELYVYVNHITDGNKIVQQILPFFTPDWTVNILFVDETGLTFDVPIILTSVEMDDSHWGDTFTERRVLIWTLAFEIKTYFLGPVKSKPIIKFAKERVALTSNNLPLDDTSDIVSQITVSPGLDSAGNPTSNSSATIDQNIIIATDDFGYIETFQEGRVIYE